ncbi:MAG: cobalamin biosynthesis protein CbiG [Lachnospiraceae bacterium]|nr:cobalamin biosynthesis protein CbiG [Lachnospiraceae bacterium]
MKVYAICFTPGGEETLGKILDGFERWMQEELCVRAFALGSYRNQAGESHGFDARVQAVQGRLSEWMAETVQDTDAFVFVGAAGIAIRAIAPYVADKTKDPALVVADEKGQFVIPLLSGHIGGANELALRIAAEIGAEPVLTTATDVRGLFAVDVFAKKNDLWISDMKQAKLISARLVRGEKVGFYSDVPLEGELPAELVNAVEQVHAKSPDETAVSCGIVISAYEKQIFEDRLLLVPRCLTVGIGCKRGASKDKILEAVQEVFAQTGLSLKAICSIASIDLKKDEAGLIGTAQEFGVSFETFSAEELSAVEGDFSESSFVKGVTGVDNVCERAAVLVSGGELLVRKVAKDGVTVAVAIKIKNITIP